MHKKLHPYYCTGLCKIMSYCDNVWHKDAPENINFYASQCIIYLISSST